VEHGSTSSRPKADDAGSANASEPSVADAPEDSVGHSSTSSRPEADDAVEHGSTSPPSQAREDAGSANASEPSVADAPDDAEEHGSAESESAPDGSTAGTTTIRVGGLSRGFYVEDDGFGIPAAESEEVFEYGYSTDEEGAGLGLSIVEAVAEAHGWTVSVTESAEGGARFVFTSGPEPGAVGTAGA
jgi:hypothetical protein